MIFLKYNLNNFKCEVKNLELTFKTNFIIFKGLYITPKKDERNHIE